MNFTRHLLLLAAITQGAACTNLANNLQDPAVWERIGQIQERHAHRDYEQKHAIYEVTGDWVFHTRAGEQINTVRHGNGGIMVIPNDGGKAVFYSEAGRNLYRSGNATYHFYSRNHADWRSGNTKIRLQRLSY